MSTERIAEFGVMVGAPGGGKTHLIRRILDRLKEQQAEHYRALIFPANRDDAAKSWPGITELSGRVGLVRSPDDPRKKVPAWKYDEPLSFTGERLVHLDGSTKKLPAAVNRYDGFRDGALVVDDVKNAIPSKGDLPGWVVAWLNSRRHRMQDIFLSCHAFSDLNVDLLAKGPRLFVFATTVGLTDAVYGKIPRANELAEVVERVNRENAARPEGERHYFEVFQLEGS